MLDRKSRNARRFRFVVLASVVGLLPFLGACNNAGESAVSGAGIGALTGLIIGSYGGNAGKSAAIGAAIGGASGAVLGDQNERADRRARESGRYRY